PKFRLLRCAASDCSRRSGIDGQEFEWQRHCSPSTGRAHVAALPRLRHVYGFLSLVPSAVRSAASPSTTQTTQQLSYSKSPVVNSACVFDDERCDQSVAGKRTTPIVVKRPMPHPYRW